MLCDMGRRIFYCILIYWKIQLLILILSLIKVLEAQTVSLQLCNSPTKGSACQILCTTTNHTQDVTFTSNGNQRGTCTIIGGSSICGANTNQPSGTVTTYDITTLSRTSDEGSWVCSYGSATDTKTLTVLTFPSTPSSADITHSSGMTTDLQANLSQTVNLAVVMDCTYPQPTVTWRFKKCSSTSALTSKSGNVAEDATASTVCGSPEKNYESTTSISSRDDVAGNCVEPEVDIIVNGVTAHTVTAGFTITFPAGVETTSDSTGLSDGAIAGIICSIVGVAAIVAAVVAGVLKKYPCQKGSNNKKPDSGNSGSRSVTPNQVSPSIITTDKKIERSSKVNEKNTKPLSPSALALTNEAKPGGRALPPIPKHEKKKKTPRKKKKRVKTEDGEDTEKLPPIQKKERNIEHYTRDTQDPES